MNAMPEFYCSKGGQDKMVGKQKKIHTEVVVG